MSNLNDVAGTVVVLNFQGEAWLDDCLNSLAAQNTKNFRTIVVDNGSTDNSAKIALAHNVQWLPLEDNLGFSRGNNAGAQLAEGDFLIFLNNDMRVRADFVSTIFTTLANDATIFAVDVAHEDFSGRPSHGAVQLDLERRPLLPARRVLTRENCPTVVTEVAYACGGAIGVRRAIFDKLGGFDGRMLAGWEDLDLCLRASLYGWRTVFVPALLCEHRVGGASSTPEGFRMRRRGVAIGRLVLAAKLLPTRDAWAEWIGVCARCLASTDLWPVLARAARVLPSVLRERRSLFREAGTTPTNLVMGAAGLNRREP